jgi:hypothetical protein
MEDFEEEEFEEEEEEEEKKMQERPLIIWNLSDDETWEVDSGHSRSSFMSQSLNNWVS